MVPFLRFFCFIKFLEKTSRLVGHCPQGNDDNRKKEEDLGLNGLV